MRKFKVNYRNDSVKLAECQFNDFEEDKDAIFEFLMLIINESIAETVYTMFTVCSGPVFIKDYCITLSDNIISIFRNSKTSYLEEIKE